MPNAVRENLFIINNSIILKSQIFLDQNIMLRILHDFFFFGQEVNTRPISSFYKAVLMVLSVVVTPSFSVY